MKTQNLPKTVVKFPYMQAPNQPNAKPSQPEIFLRTFGQKLKEDDDVFLTFVLIKAYLFKY